MDPSQKNWSILNKYIKKIPANVNNANNQINTFINTETTITSTTTNHNSTDHKEKKQKITNSRQKMLEILQTSRSESNSIKEEVKSYFDFDVSETESLDWWQQHKHVFPNVAKLASVCFGIPATSASSVAGNCVNSKRSTLHPATLKNQLFVHDNRAIVEQLL